MRESDRPHRLSVRTAPFHGAERGSIPLGAIAGGGRREREASEIRRTAVDCSEEGLTDKQSEMEGFMRKGFSTLTPELGP